MDVTVKKEIAGLIGRRLKEVLSRTRSDDQALPPSITYGLEILRQAEMRRARQQPKADIAPCDETR